MTTEEPEDTLMVHKPQETAVAHEPQETAVVHKPHETAVVYEAVQEAQAQNTDDIMSANTETLENDIGNRYGPRSNHDNIRPRCEPTYNNFSLNTVLHKSGDVLLHYMLTQQSVDELKQLDSREVLEPI